MEIANKTKKSTGPKAVSGIISIICCIACAVIIAIVTCSAIGVWTIHDNTIRIRTIEDKIKRIEAQLQDVENNFIAESEYERVIAFLKEETSQHRNFIEQQRQQLIWLVGAIAAIAVAMHGFLGLKRRKDVENLIEENYKECIDGRVNRQINILLGGEEKREYLESCVNKESQAKQKAILFLRTDSCTQLSEVIDSLKEMGFNKLKDRIIPANASPDYLKELINNENGGTHIVIYEVGGTSSQAERSTYELISKICEEMKKYCIIYIKGRIEGTLGTTTSYSNMIVTVYERLNTLLYSIPTIPED